MRYRDGRSDSGLQDRVGDLREISRLAARERTDERTGAVGLFNWREKKVPTHYATAHPVFGTADTASPIMPPEMREFFLSSPMLSGRWDTEVNVPGSGVRRPGRLT